MTVYQPIDSLIGPIVAAIAQIIQSQVAGVSVIYQQLPDGPPEDGSVIIPLTLFKVLDDTNGKLSVRLTFGVRHMFRRSSFPENISAAYSYFMPYMQVFSQWSNQNLGGLCRQLTPSQGGVTQMVSSGQAFVALIVNLEVLAEFNIPTN